MKTSPFLTAILLISGLLSACAISNNSVDSEGNCTDSFITAYKAIDSEKETLKLKVDTKIYTESEITAAFQSLNNACQRFYASHANVICKDQSRSSSERTVYSSDHRSICDAANKYVSEAALQCTPLFVDQYNNVLDTSAWLKSSLDSPYGNRDRILRNADLVKSMCSTFFTLNTSTTRCKAKVGGLSRFVGASDVAPFCEFADQVAKSGGAVSTPAPVPIAAIKL